MPDGNKKQPEAVRPCYPRIITVAGPQWQNRNNKILTRAAMLMGGCVIRSRLRIIPLDELYCIGRKLVEVKERVGYKGFVAFRDRSAEVVRTIGQQFRGGL